ncbi:MAG: hypothetical protein KF816_04600 [Melioribacteraceae bacterium]|nr:hypothetical protein [Melioribacteraceae bacterium]
MYEHKREQLIPITNYYFRLLKHFIFGFGIILFSLLIGVFGYHFIEGLNWIDSLLNSSMILGGMGPVDILKSDGGKLFASFYALYSGIIFLVIAGVFFAPILHRLLHKFHVDEK